MSVDRGRIVQRRLKFVWVTHLSILRAVGGWPLITSST